MIYGTTLRLPGEFTKQYTVDANTDLGNYSDKLRVAMSRLRLCPPRATQQNNIFQYKEIATCTHVFLRRIAIAPPLISSGNPQDPPRPSSANTQTPNRTSVKKTQSTAVRSSTKLTTVPQQLDDKVKLSDKDKTYIAPHSRVPAVSCANGNGGGLRTYSRIPLHLQGKTPGAADAVIDSNKRNRSNIVNRDKISTDATVRKTRVGREIQTPARLVQMVHAIVAPNDIYCGPNRMYRNNNVFKL